MTPKILAPRRVLVAVLIVATLGSASVLAVGATEAGGLGEVPKSWGVAEPRIGDRGTYTYALVGPDGKSIGGEVPYYAFEQAEARTVLDNHGEPLLVNVLNVTSYDYSYSVGGDDGLTWGPRPAHHAYQAPDGRIPFDEVSHTDAHGGDGVGVVSVGDVQVLPGKSTSAGAFAWRFYGDDVRDRNSLEAGLGLCGIRNALQGRERDLDGSVDLLGDCPLHLGGVDPGRPTVSKDDASALRETTVHGYLSSYSDTFAALGLQRLGDREALVFGQRHVDRDQWPFDDDGGELDGLRVWMARDVPYPVQLALRDGDNVHVLRLTGFQAGDRPLATGPGTGASAPPFQMAAPKPWGIDDAGQPGFQASQAWQAALDDGPLANYLDSHPDAVAFEVVGEASSWSFSLTDGPALFAVVVQQVHDDAVALPSAVPPVPVPPGLPLPAQVDQQPSYAFDYPALDWAPPVDRSSLPVQWPTASSVLTRWAAFTGIDMSGASVGYKFTCDFGFGPIYVLGDTQLPFDECVYIPVVLAQFSNVTFGSPVPDPASPVPSDPGTSRVDVVFGSAGFAVDGDLLESILSQGNATVGYGLPSLAPSTARSPYQPPPGYAEWRFPSTEVVAGLGFLAVLAGLAYLLWPLAKGGVLAGYARVSDAEVLEHPQRQRILAVVEAQPGIHLKEIARQTGMAWGQTQHHVGKLVQASALVAKPTSGYTCYFPKGVDRNVMGVAHVLKADGARRLLEHVAATTGLSMGQLARAAGLTESTAHYHLKKLEAAGLVSTMLLDGTRRVSLTPLGAEAGRRFGSGATSPAAAS